MIYPEEIELLVDFFSEIPGISERAAERAILNISSLPEEERKRIMDAFSRLGEIRSCRECGLPAKKDLCTVCSDKERDRSSICVVEQPRDAVSIEKTGSYRGLYHVLGGVISPIEGISPEDLTIKKLLKRVKGGNVKNVIIALNPTVEGEATSKFLIERLKGMNVKIYRIGYGIPYGGTIDTADELTLRKALEDMKQIGG